MPYRFPLFIIIYFMSVYAVQAQQSDIETITRGTLKVMVMGMKNDLGLVRIAMFDSAVNYTQNSETFRRALTKIVNKKAEIEFTDIPFGEYAIQLFHDENNNEILDRNFMGLPTEPYGFSNNIRGKFGPPEYDQVKFDFRSPNQIITIKVK